MLIMSAMAVDPSTFLLLKLLFRSINFSSRPLPRIGFYDPANKGTSESYKYMLARAEFEFTTYQFDGMNISTDKRTGSKPRQKDEMFKVI